VVSNSYHVGLFLFKTALLKKQLANSYLVILPLSFRIFAPPSKKRSHFNRKLQVDCIKMARNLSSQQ
jgi:hypothetical protein